MVTGQVNFRVYRRDEAGVYQLYFNRVVQQDMVTSLFRDDRGRAWVGTTRSGALLDLTGGSGEPEETVRWMAETGELGLSAPDSKYLTRLELRVQPERRARLEALVSYDGGRRWEKLGEVIGGDGQTRGYLLHLRPRRCRQLRLRLKGTGRCRVYSLSAVYEKGSDGP